MLSKYDVGEKLSKDAQLLWLVTPLRFLILAAKDPNRWETTAPLVGKTSGLRSNAGTKSVEVFRPTLRQGRSRQTSLKHKLAQG